MNFVCKNKYISKRNLIFEAKYKGYDSVNSDLQHLHTSEDYIKDIPGLKLGFFYPVIFFFFLVRRLLQLPLQHPYLQKFYLLIK